MTSPPDIPPRRDRTRSFSPSPSDVSDREVRLRKLEEIVGKLTAKLTLLGLLSGAVLGSLIALGAVTVDRTIVTAARVDALEHRVQESTQTRREVSRDVATIAVKLGELSRDMAAVRREQERVASELSDRFDRLDRPQRRPQ